MNLNLSSTSKVISLLILGVIVFILNLILFFKWGPIINFDTFIYFNMAKIVVEGDFPYSSAYSPGYSFLIGIIHKITKLSYEKIATFLVFLVYLSSIFLWSNILKSIFEEIKSFYLAIFGLLITNFMWSIKIIYFVHADSFFYFFILLIAYQIVLWIQDSTNRKFFLISFLAAISLWIKYNGLIFLPFLTILPILSIRGNRKYLLSFIPIFLILFSFFLYKKINNGEVIKHLETNREIEWWQGEDSRDTLKTNLKDAGKEFFDFFFPKSMTSFSVQVFGYGGFLFLLIFGVWLFVHRKYRIAGIFYSFSLLYIFGYMFISHFTNHTEINQRTMFPGYIFLTISLLYVFKFQASKWKWVLIGFFALSLIRSIFGFSDLIWSGSINSFKKIELLKERGSVQSLNSIMKEHSINPNMVYTNNPLYLAALLEYSLVSRFPEKTDFIRGKFREKTKDQLTLEIFVMINNLNSGKALIVLFDYENELMEELAGFKTISIDSDIIIYSE